MKSKDDSKKLKYTKETQILFFLLLVTNIFFVGLLYYQYKLYANRAFNNSYTLIDPARSLIAQEHFFSTIEPLRKQLKEVVAKYEKEGIKIGLYFEYLNTGSNISINQDSRFWPASLSKMPTALVVMKKIENGDWKFTNELVLFEQDKDERFGELYKKPTGTRFTIEELLKAIIIDSDNTAHMVLVRNLSGDEYLSAIEALGMEDLFDKDYNITAKEYSRIFRSLYSASYLNREHSQILLSFASETRFDDFLGSGLPSNILFSHKIGEGDLEENFLDSGIVYVPNRPYLITVMIDVKEGGDKEKARDIMKEISDLSYKYVSKNQ